jgi:acid phosphatase family membrane protein YuiD
LRCSALGARSPALAAICCVDALVCRDELGRPAQTTNSLIDKATGSLADYTVEI